MKSIKFNLIFLSLVLLGTTGFTKNYQYNNVIVFGDSLSDMGNRQLTGLPYTNNQVTVLQMSDKSVAGSLDPANKIYLEYLTEIFSGKKSIPMSNGGNNFAVAGSTAQSKYEYEYSLQQMAQQYLNFNKVNPDNLYIIWSGGNDISYEIRNEMLASFLPFTVENNPSLAIAETSQLLISHGANTVVVPNLFDMGKLPVPMKILFNSTNNLLLNWTNLIPMPGVKNLTRSIISWGFNSFIALPIDNYLRSQDNLPLANETTEQFFKRFYQRGFGILVGTIIYHFSTIGTRNAIKHRSQLESLLLPMNGHIVYVDIYQLFQEIIDNPRLYGIDDIAMPVCSLVTGSFDAIACGTTSPLYHHKNYLWSDGVHPSAYAHQIYANYIESIVNAPIHVSSITRQLNQLENASASFLAQELYSLNSTIPNRSFIPLLGVSGLISKIGYPYHYGSKFNHNHLLHIGFISSVNQTVNWGGLLSLSYDTANPFNQFSFNYNSQLLQLFLQSKLNRIQANLSTSLILNIGQLNARHLNRSIHLGSTTRMEQGTKTKAKNWGIQWILGHDYAYSTTLILNSFLKVNWQKSQQKGYQEKQATSTSMRFSGGKYHQTEIGVGFKINQIQPKLKTYLAIELDIPVQHKTMEIYSGLKNTALSFNRKINMHNKIQFNLSGGINKEISKNLALNANINFKIDRSRNRQYEYHLGLRYH